MSKPQLEAVILPGAASVLHVTHLSPPRARVLCSWALYTLALVACEKLPPHSSAVSSDAGLHTGDSSEAVDASATRTLDAGSGEGPGPSSGSADRGVHQHHAYLPRVRSSVPDVRGPLAKEVIHRIIKRHVNEVRYCYEVALPSRPDLQGQLTMRFTIAPTGEVPSAVVERSELHDPDMESCIAKAVQRWTFPAPEGGRQVAVSYTIDLSPPGE